MKRIFVIGYAALLFASISYAQESTPAPPALEPQAPQRPGPWRSSPPAQEVVPVPVPIAPPKPNGPVQKSLVRITAKLVEHDYRAPLKAGRLLGGGGDRFVCSVTHII